MIAKSHRWQKTALAAATTALLSIFALDATALSLGRITVLSALGEPLRAEIDIPDINVEEAASLKAAVALPEAFRAAGLEYNPAMASLQATLQKRTDGRFYIKLSSSRPISEPFVDVILEANWATGRIVRDYTMLFDPPSLRVATPAAETPAQVPTQSSANGATTGGSTAPSAAARRSPDTRANLVRTPVGAINSKAPDTGALQLSVKPGDTASKIAAATKPTSVSLDQMLVALLRTNPTAFAGNNVNRLKAGTVINVPTEEQAGATPVPEAAQIIVAQSKDFNDFRRKLAGNAPSTLVEAADRKASGEVQAKVEEKKPLTTAPDKLTLSKGPIQKQSVEDQLAVEKNAREAASRAAEISKNISDLNKLGVASNAVAPVPVASASTTAPAVATPAVTVAAAVASGAQAPVASAAAPVVKQPAAVRLPQAEPGPFDSLIENPLLPIGAIGLTALLAFFGFYRTSKRKSRSTSDSVFLESRSRPDSFFGVSGGQSVDTHDSAATGSSMAYSPSQLDAVDNVDPVAEADVYLAYGRDLQAEEILKDALQSNPDRLAIHQKLLVIFAKRSDSKSFERIATLAFKLTNGQGSDWERICELGLSIDPSNALYLPGGQPDKPAATTAQSSEADADDISTGNTQTLATQAAEPHTSGFVDLDLDLDFSVDQEAHHDLVEASSHEAPTKPESVSSIPTEQLTAASFVASGPTPLASPPEAASTPDFDMLKFDLESLSLDLDTTSEDDNVTLPAADEDPLATKLALAEEFKAIGDHDGARTLIKEVLSEASGNMKMKAQSALNNL